MVFERKSFKDFSLPYIFPCKISTPGRPFIYRRFSYMYNIPCIKYGYDWTNGSRVQWFKNCNMNEIITDRCQTPDIFIRRAHLGLWLSDVLQEIICLKKCFLQRKFDVMHWPHIHLTFIYFHVRLFHVSTVYFVLNEQLSTYYTNLVFQCLG